jgi:Tol biopolymer transport system component
VYLTSTAGTVSRLMLAAGSSTRPLVADAQRFAFPRFSPDGQHLALAITTDRTDVWILDLPSGPFRRLTVEGTSNDRPEWTADSRNVLFRSNRSGLNAIWIQPADGHRQADLLYAFPRFAVDEGVLSPNGEYLIVQLDSTRDANGGQVFYRRMRGDTAVKLIAGADRGQQVHARVSRDGGWVAYSSSELGNWDVYVKPFPSLGARYQVSLSGGAQPVWSPDGRRLFYISGGRLLSATLAYDPFRVVSRDTVLEDVLDSPLGEGSTSFYHANYDVASDGKSIVFLRGGTSSGRVIVVHGWKAELRARMAGAGKR